MALISLFAVPDWFVLEIAKELPRLLQQKARDEPK